MLKRSYQYLRREGSVRFFRVIVINLICLPVALMIMAIAPWVRIRVMGLLSERIGHFALNTELLLCAIDEKMSNTHQQTYTFFYQSSGPLSNTQLNAMWKRSIRVIPFPYFCAQLDRMLKHLSKTYCNDQIKNYFEVPDGAHDRWQLLTKNHNCHISFTVEEEREGNELTRKLGIPDNAKFICLLVRDSQYLKKHIPDNDWSYHEIRDADIQNYATAAKFLAEKGYFVVRMGKFVEKPFINNDPRIIDYATHELRTDFMDIYLPAKCHFMISTGSGLDAIAQIFRKPLLITDFPLCDLRTWNNWDLFIPKKIFDKKNQRFLSFKRLYEARDLFTDKKRLKNILAENEWIFIDNCPDEIMSAVSEMFEKMEGKKLLLDDSLVQEKFWQNYPIQLPIGVDSYNEIKLQIGKAFYTKYQSRVDDFSPENNKVTDLN